MTTPTLAILGILLALFGAPALLIGFKTMRVDSVSLLPRIAVWLLAAAVVLIAFNSNPTATQDMGLRSPTLANAAFAALAVFALLATWPPLQWLQKKLGGSTSDQTENFRKMAMLPFPHRVFLVITAGVVEEVLYRGYAIGIGSSVLGGATTAIAISGAVFILAHFGWGISHLLSVLWATVVLTTLFLVTQNLVVCILAHVAFDAIGILVAPALMNRARQTSEPGHQS